jgi:hypothetical protein
MAEVSIIELIVYGLIGYPAVIMLIVSSFRGIEATDDQAGIKAIWILPAIICMFMLASAGGLISMQTQTVNDIGYNVTDQSIITNSTTTHTTQINLVQPVWITLHYMFFVILLIYFIWNMLQLFTKKPKGAKF